jgi:predicted nucleic acid-binding Zn ribbon protein
LYRALERDPRNRYGKAHDFIWDLQHLDKVGVEDREELHGWNKRKARQLRRILYYTALALIPVVAVLLLFLAAHWR